ncbi:hypothetical protein BGZ63DRAFT_206429 [Mariannaea sp. PMI_226]|nr:hypothetical protein BGZ63DRAFT_206429 [Mariannaea sp. PMI_226]
MKMHGCLLVESIPPPSHHSQIAASSSRTQKRNIYCYGRFETVSNWSWLSDKLRREDFANGPNLTIQSGTKRDCSGQGCVMVRSFYNAYIQRCTNQLNLAFYITHGCYNLLLQLRSCYTVDSSARTLYPLLIPLAMSVTTYQQVCHNSRQAQYEALVLTTAMIRTTIVTDRPFSYRSRSRFLVPPLYLKYGAI